MENTIDYELEPMTDAEVSAMETYLAEIQKMKSIADYLRILATPPKDVHLKKSADGKATVVSVKYVERLLDEIYGGEWSTDDFRYQVVANEIIGSITLKVIHPVTGREILRTGAASQPIMMNKAPDNLSDAEKSIWAQNQSNKKNTALTLNFPNLLSKCTTNAARKLGAIFGAYLNTDTAPKNDAPRLMSANKETAFSAMKKTIAGLLAQGYSLDHIYNKIGYDAKDIFCVVANYSPTLQLDQTKK